MSWGSLARGAGTPTAGRLLEAEGWEDAGD